MMQPMNELMQPMICDRRRTGAGAADAGCEGAGVADGLKMRAERGGEDAHDDATDDRGDEDARHNEDGGL